MIESGKGPESLLNQDSAPIFNLTSQHVGWKGAFFADVRGRAQGKTDHGHTRFCLQLFDKPRQQRALTSSTWTTAPAGLRICLPGDEQRYEARGPSNNRFLFVEPERVEEIIGQPWTPCMFERHRGQIAPSTLATQLLGAMSQDLAHGSPAGALVGDSLITALIASLCSKTAPQEFGESQGYKLSCRDITRLTEYVDGVLEQQISLDSLAGLVNLSQRHFRRVLHATLACSPHQFVLSRRLERARELIADNRQCLSEIAAATGFADQSHMTRTFQRSFGLPPSRYRKQAGGAENPSGHHATSA